MKQVGSWIFGTWAAIIVAVLLPPFARCADTVPAASAAIILHSRLAHVIPLRLGFTHTGGGIIDVAQPAPDTVITNMTGVAVGGGHPCKDSVASWAFDLCQDLEIKTSDAKVNRIKVTIESRMIGLLRSQKKGCGSAFISAAHAALVSSGGEIVAVSLTPHSVAGGENLSLNDHEGPMIAIVPPGKYTLHATFAIGAEHAKSMFPTKAASAEFAPDPALDPLWISAWEPFHGAAKKDFGYQVLFKVGPE